MDFLLGLKMLLNSMYSHLIEAGCDEAGRGCLAGPVFAAAVILPSDFMHPGLNDSKLMKESVRMELREIIIKEAISYGIAQIDPQEIDRINILQASVKAMQKAVLLLKPKPEHLLIDGNYFKSLNQMPYTTVVKGDGKYANIAAASVLAKTSRDLYMTEMDQIYPEYQWRKNKGYPTKDHRNAIREWGTCKLHRQSFKLLPEQLKLAF